ncbi:hypothetical protein C5167_012802 [Papaver somniferum]|uniref:Uncharacterized protein n=1 Tax=Papaver somniferum TaxID=3469 RepID=A0A4Y7IYI2_PAPSO|nr:hypothetical protein C5167_012802 [Papaver somniferum]
MAAAKRKRTEPSEHILIDYLLLRNVVFGRETPYNPKLVIVKQEDGASAPPLGPISLFVLALRYLCTYGPDNHCKGFIKWVHRTEEVQVNSRFNDNSDEHYRDDPYELHDLYHPKFKMNSLAGLESIKKFLPIKNLQGQSFKKLKIRWVQVSRLQKAFRRLWKVLKRKLGR